MFARKWLLTTVLVIAGAGVCIRLGIWQLDRLAQRRISNAHYLAMEAMNPIELPADSSIDLTTMEYRAIRAHGAYDFNQQVALRTQYYQNQYGYRLMTPLVLSDGTAIIVDRGWIPAEGNDGPSTWSRYDQGDEEIGVSGIVRLSRASPELGGVPDPTLAPGQSRLDFWNMPNIGRIQEQVPYKLLPVYIQADSDPARTDPPIPIQPEVDLSEGPHMGYALQWFAFSAILFFGYPFYLRRQNVLEVSP
jgi:surfeit locus 1 family protein